MVAGAFLALALVCLVHELPWLPGVLLIPELLAVVVLYAWLTWGQRIGVALIPAVGALLAAGWATGDRLAPDLVQRDIVVPGTVCAIPRTLPTVHRFLFRSTDRVRLPGLPRRIYLSWYRTDRFPEAGEAWQLKVRLKRPRGLSNPGGFDFERWAYVGRIGATGYVRKSALNRRISADSADCRLAGWRQRIAGRLHGVLAGSPAAGYLVALSVGARTGLSPADWALLRRTGTVHLMAISGLHVGLVAGLLFLAGRNIGRLLLLAGAPVAPLSVGRWLALAGATAYCTLAGFSIPTIRAFVMVVVVMTLATMRRSVAGWRILAAALFVVLCTQPSSPLSAGFWLSFYAVGLLLLRSLTFDARDMTSRSVVMRIVGRFAQLVRAQLTLTIGLAPLGIWYFAQVSVIGPVSNLIVVPLFAFAVVPLTLTGTGGLIIGSSILQGLSQACLGMAARIMETVLDFLAWVDGASFALWYPPPVTLSGILIIVVLTIVAVWPRPLKGRLAVLTLLSMFVVGSAPTEPPGLRVVVVDVGQGLAVLIQTRTRALVYDAGPPFRGDATGRSMLFPVLRHFGVRRLDTLVISHGDADHAGGAASLVARFPDTEVLAPASFEMQADNSDGPRQKTCAGGMVWHWNGIRFEILHPNRGESWSENDASCVLLVRSAYGSILLPGDIERPAEKRLSRKAIVPLVDVVVAPHHGSRSSSSQAFIAATRPRFVVFSAGYRNRWGFPDEAVVKRWREAGACALTTARGGALIFETDRAGRLELRGRHRIDARSFWTEGPSATDHACQNKDVPAPRPDDH